MAPSKDQASKPAPRQAKGRQPQGGGSFMGPKGDPAEGRRDVGSKPTK